MRVTSTQAAIFRPPFPQLLAEEAIEDFEVLHLYGRNYNVGTSSVVISHGAVYQTPQVGSQTTLRIKAGGNANDTAAGTGAREVTLYGIDENGDEISEAVATAGASASAATTEQFLRLTSAVVTKSGSYAATGASSHAGDIVIENGAGGTDWATIETDIIPICRTEIGYTTIPSGYSAYVYEFYGYSDSAKISDIQLCARTNILQTSAPYDPLEVLKIARVRSGQFYEAFTHPIKVQGPADLGVMGNVDAGTSDISVAMEIVVVKDTAIPATPYQTTT